MISALEIGYVESGYRFAVQQLPMLAHEKSHSMSLRRHAMTSILTRDNPCPALPAWAQVISTHSIQKH